jgi:hypothetical protein
MASLSSRMCDAYVPPSFAASAASAISSSVFA